MTILIEEAPDLGCFAIDRDLSRYSWTPRSTTAEQPRKPHHEDVELRMHASEMHDPEEATMGSWEEKVAGGSDSVQSEQSHVSQLLASFETKTLSDH